MDSDSRLASLRRLPRQIDSQVRLHDESPEPSERHGLAKKSDRYGRLAAAGMSQRSIQFQSQDLLYDASHQSLEVIPEQNSPAVAPLESPKKCNPRVPIPSSFRDILTDSSMLERVKRRLQDEAEDTTNVCRVTQHLKGVRHIAAGRHRLGMQAYAHWRADSAKRKRDLNRHNRAVRLVNLVKVLHRKHPQMALSLDAEQRQTYEELLGPEQQIEASKEEDIGLTPFHVGEMDLSNRYQTLGPENHEASQGLSVS